jgi:hypothetical protein
MSTALEDPGVFFQWMMNIENDNDENSEIAGLRFRYDCSGVFADTTLSTEELTTEQKSGSVVAEFLERYCEGADSIEKKGQRGGRSITNKTKTNQDPSYP